MVRSGRWSKIARRAALSALGLMLAVLVGACGSVSVVHGPAATDPYLAGFHAQPVAFGDDYRTKDGSVELVRPAANFHTGDHVAWMVTLADPADAAAILVLAVRLNDGTTVPQDTDVTAGTTDLYYGRTSGFTKTGEYSLRVYAGGSLAGEGRINVDAPVPTPTPTPRIAPHSTPKAAARVQPAARPEADCTPGYSPCIPSGSSDVDCSGGTGDGPRYTEANVRYRVTGSDPYRLDGNGDGWACG